MTISIDVAESVKFDRGTLAALNTADAANSQSLPAYEIYNLNLQWRASDALTVSAHGVNLSNEIGLTEGNPRAGQFVSGNAGARFYTARPVLGRSYRLALTYRF